MVLLVKQPAFTLCLVLTLHKNIRFLIENGCFSNFLRRTETNKICLTPILTPTLGQSWCFLIDIGLCFHKKHPSSPCFVAVDHQVIPNLREQRNNTACIYRFGRSGYDLGSRNPGNFGNQMTRCIYFLQSAHNTTDADGVPGEDTPFL